MKKHLAMFTLAVLVVLVLLANTVAFKLDTTENAVVRTFGATSRQYEGKTDAGLHFKWPWPIQKVVFYEARRFVFEDTYGEVTLGDNLNVLATMYCCWQITDPTVFQTKFPTQLAGQEKIREFLRANKTKALSSRKMEDLVNTDPTKMMLPEIEKEVLNRVSSDMEGYGVSVVAIGIKSLGLPETVTPAVIENMKSERQRDVRSFRAAGESTATTIRERARAAAAKITSFAETKAARITAEGESAAAKYFALFAGNEEFSKFLRSMESLRGDLGDRTTIILDASVMPAVGYFNHGPQASQPVQPGK